MADVPPPNPVPPSPSGALPPKKETGKVQPKKETVRINLPPKPAAAPTIKLPTLPPGGPTGAPSPTPVPAPAPSPVAVRPASAAPAAAPAATISKPATAAPSATQRPAAATPPRPAAAAAPTPAPGLKLIDKILVYSATVASLAAVGVVVWIFLNLKNTVETFTP